MKNKFFAHFSAIVLLLFLWGCNPANNTLINRFYHSTTARYNGYFNANLLLDDALNSYRNNLKEDYFSLLPIEPYPNETEVTSLYPAIDTALAKCTKVIQEHSMPGSSKPTTKKEENNSFIDENWITIGQASFLRRDYSAAEKNFQFIKKFYNNDPSNYIGELWMARTKLAEKRVSDAAFHIKTVDRAVAAQGEKSRLSVFFDKFNKPAEGTTKQAPLPKGFLETYHLTKAHYHQLRQEQDSMIFHLEMALEKIKKKNDKARIYYILGQIYEKEGKRQFAQENYAKVLKSNPSFEMAFSARLKRALLSGDAKLVKDLTKMLRDAKNAEYKDQIYYALAQIELNKKNIPGVFTNLTNSAFYSTSNPRQKAMAYEQMGDLKFKAREYVTAQKYYDSTAQFMPENYPNGEGIRNKAEKLNELVIAVETASFEDSVLRIADMSAGERETYIEKVIVQLKAREKERKRLEAEKLALLAKNETNFNQNQGGSKWYFRNAKTRAEGFDEFKRQWGQRNDEDDWRRSDKLPSIAAVTENEDSLETQPETKVADKELSVDSLTVDILMKNIPLDDSSKAKSRENLSRSLFNAGVIYKDQLNEENMAAAQFNDVLQRPWDSNFKLLSAFQLYRLKEKKQPEVAAVHKNFILSNYPNSDYANYIRDPDYFIKKKVLDAEAEKEYLKVLDRYNTGSYYLSFSLSETALSGDPKNVFRPKYFLLKALSQGQINEDKKVLIPTLEQLVKEFPGSDEAKRAQEMLLVIKNGYSQNLEVDYSKKSLFKYDDNVKHYVIIFLGENENSSLAKTKVSDFTREFFSRDKLKVSSKIYGSNQSIIFVEEFASDLPAKEYVRVYKGTRKHLLDLQGAKILAITPNNLKVLFETQNLKEYEDFYLEYY